MSENWWQSEICIVINNKLQDSTAWHLSCDELLHYKFIIHFAGERIFKIGEHLAMLQEKWLIVLYAPFALDFCLQRCRTRQISYGQEFSVLFFDSWCRLLSLCCIKYECHTIVF